MCKIKRKVVIPVVLIIALVLPTFPVLGANGGAASGSYYHKAVTWAYENGIVSGTSDKTFSPDKPVTRSEAITLIYRFAKGEASSENTLFTDVKPNSYYEKAVIWSTENSIVKGLTNNTFGPCELCTRAQVLTFLYRLNLLTDKETN